MSNIIFNFHFQILSEEAGLKLSVLGLSGAKSAGAQLEPGVYFAEHQADGSLGELAGQMAVNRITEHEWVIHPYFHQMINPHF
jgi:hypothetical protein